MSEMNAQEQVGSGANEFVVGAGEEVPALDPAEASPQSVVAGGRRKSRKNRRSARKNKKSKRLSVKKLLKMVGMKGGNVTAEASPYVAESAAGGNTSTQVISTFGGIGQQTGSAGPSSGLIQPLSQGKMGGGRRRKRGGFGPFPSQAGTVKGGSAVASEASNVETAYGKLVTVPGGNSTGAAHLDGQLANRQIYAQNTPSKPIMGGSKKRNHKKH